MLDYKLIEALWVVIDEGGFEKGARKLHITQSAVSQRIRQLEDFTGQVLIRRTVPPEPTEAGKKILKLFIQVKTLENDYLGSMEASGPGIFNSITIGINADSLSTWTVPAISPFLASRNIVVDFHVDDQEETHKLLKNGTVMGCISSREVSVQGCATARLGTMRYRMCATPEFTSRWFGNGFSIAAVEKAPAVIFNRKDNLHARVLKRMFGKTITGYPVHYVPSPEMFGEFIFKGLGYGMIPDLQSKAHLASGAVVEPAMELAVDVPLYWHRWNIKWDLLDHLTKALIAWCREHLH